MKLDPYDVDITKDDISTLNKPDSFNKNSRITIDDARLSMDVPIVVKYDYVDLELTDYNFKQKFDLKDTQEYFSMMKTISSNTINRLQQNAKDYHLYRSNLKGNLKTAIKKIFQDVDENIIIYHFGLYECESKQASRETGERSPRIYFILGNNGHVYILFFDPYHELNPM